MASTIGMAYPSDPHRVVVFPHQQQTQAQAHSQQRHRASQYTRKMAAIDEYDLPPRPTRQRKISHRGASGLFDDIDERDYRDAHEMHQVQRAQGGGHQSARKERAARRVAMGKPAESRFEGFVARVFTRQSRKEVEAEVEVKEEDDERSETDTQGKSIVEEAAIYQQKEAAATAAAATGDSLFLRECGMVRVKTNAPGGCIIVPRNFVYREDFTYREDRDAGWI